ncbi:MAG: hypothetical protein WD512_18710 [Candidatus Paceibacterota bacterium]
MNNTNYNLIKLEKLDKSWENTLSAGWTTSYGWQLGLNIQDITLLTGAFMLAKEANSLGINTPSYIVDADGVSHEIDLTNLTNLMLQYGQARSLLSQEYANKKSLIKEASSIPELDSI